MKKTMSSRTLQYSLMGIFGAFHFVISIIPYSVLGTGGGLLTWGMISAPIIGYVLGARLGTGATAIGSFLMILVFPLSAIFSILTPLAPMASAFVTGSIRDGEPIIVPIIFIFAMVLFLVGPVGVFAPQFLWLHLIAGVMSFLFAVPNVKTTLRESNSLKSRFTSYPFFLWLMSFCAVLLDNLVGSMIYSYYGVIIFGDTPSALGLSFLGIIVVYPVERIIASIIVTSVLLALSLSGVLSLIQDLRMDSDILELDLEE